jgi:hypothetical protein
MDNRELTRAWIQYLKNMQMVSLQSDPETGKLNYKKPVTLAVLYQFLELSTDFTKEQIAAAIQSALAKKVNPDAGLEKPGEKEEPTTKQIGNRPAQPRLQGPAKQPPKRKFSKDGATDIPYRDVNEAIRDDAEYKMSEDEVEAVFNKLVSPSSSQSAQSQNRKSQQGQQPQQADNDKKQQDLNKIVRLIRDTMVASQRRALWRALKDV